VSQFLACRKCGGPADPNRDWWHLLRQGTVLMLTCAKCKPPGGTMGGVA
jgi:hypothetical protein